MKIISGQLQTGSDRKWWRNHDVMVFILKLVPHWSRLCVKWVIMSNLDVIVAEKVDDWLSLFIYTDDNSLFPLWWRHGCSLWLIWHIIVISESRASKWIPWRHDYVIISGHFRFEVDRKWFSWGFQNVEFFTDQPPTKSFWVSITVFSRKLRKIHSR